VSGTVVRTSAIESGNDGIGTLCLAILDGCPSMTNMSPTTFAGGQETDFDLSGSQAMPFDLDFTVLTPLQNGTEYVIGGFLQEAGGDCSQSGPSQGDPVAFGAGGCPTFTYDGGAVSGMDVEFSMNMPF